jgi:putative ABC transport system permease protein
MTSLLNDVRYGLRVLWKNPGFTAVAVLAVALGVGANTTIFSCVNALLLRPFAYPTTDRAVMVWETRADSRSSHDAVAPANYLDWRDQAKAFEELAAYNTQDFDLNDGDQPERVPGSRVTPNLFRVLAASAERGRTFTDEEGRAGHEQVVLLKHSLWQRRFASDPDITGKTIRVDGKPYTVVGVMPQEFDFPVNGGQLWTPLSFDPKEQAMRGAPARPSRRPTPRCTPSPSATESSTPTRTAGARPSPSRSPTRSRAAPSLTSSSCSARSASCF